MLLSTATTVCECSLVTKLASAEYLAKHPLICLITSGSYKLTSMAKIKYLGGFCGPTGCAHLSYTVFRTH